MKQMMKQMGIEYDMDEDNELNADDEYAKILKQMGIKEGGGDDDVMRILQAGEEDVDMMDDDALLRQYMPDELKPKSPRTEAKQAKDKAETLRAEMKKLMAAGKKTEAVPLMREFKAEMAKYNEICEKHPKVKQQLEGGPQEASQPAPQKKEEEKKQASVNPQPVQPVVTMDAQALIDIYEQYHDPEKIQSMAVIENEMSRCRGLVDGLTDDDLIAALQDRLDILEMSKDSIMSDIQNEFLTPAQYLQKIKAYHAYEVKNLARAKKDGLASDHEALIEERIKLVKGEISEGEAAGGGGEGPANTGDVPMEGEEPD